MVWHWTRQMGGRQNGETGNDNGQTAGSCGSR